MLYSLLHYEVTSLLSLDGEMSVFMRERQAQATTRKLGISLSVGAIVEAKKLALKRRVWFRSINRVERGILDLTVRYVDNIRSTKLAKVVTAILEKLQVTIESLADKLVRTVGLSLARRISLVAVSWGNRSASMWAEDRSFAKYLAFSSIKT